MRALSLWQPWASLWVYGEKINETRSWYTNFRGILHVHAAKRFQRDEKALCQDEPFRSALGLHYAKVTEIPLGALVGKVYLSDCVPVEEIRDSLSDEERAFGNYSDGRFAWVANEHHAWPTPKPYRGSQGFFFIRESEVE